MRRNEAQEVSWINRVLTVGIQAMILFLATSLPIDATQLHHPGNSLPALRQQGSSTQKRMDGIWVGVVEVSGIKVITFLNPGVETPG